MPNPARVDQLLAWLDESPRPGLATLYFDTVDHDGHEFGPESPQLNTALAAVDAHPLLLRLLGLPPMQTDGDAHVLEKALR